MWNRKNSVAIQSYAAQNSKPEHTEVDRKRVSFECEIDVFIATQTIARVS